MQQRSPVLLIGLIAALAGAGPVAAQDDDASSSDPTAAPPSAPEEGAPDERAVPPAPDDGAAHVSSHATEEPAAPIEPTTSRSDEDATRLPSPPPTDVAAATSPTDEPSATRTPGVEAAPADPTPEPTDDPGIRLGDFRFLPHGQVLMRGEGRVDPYTTAGIGRDEWFVTTRLRLGLGAQWQSVRVLLQVQDARNLGDAPPGQDAGTDMHQGYLEIGEDGSFIRAGRQEINWGGQRMIGALDWTANARSFDATRGVLRAQPSLTMEGFAAMLRSPWDFQVEELTGDPPTRTTRSIHSDGDYLAGLRGVWTLGATLTVDRYALYRHDGGATMPVPA